MKGPEERLLNMSRRNRLPHGLLFLSREEGPALSAALVLARHLLCGESPDRRPCGTCSACVRATEGNHPDLLTVEAPKQEITIEQVRELQAWIMRGPFEARAKVAILKNADLLNAPASNALLKTLEEPPPYAVLLLLAPGPDRFLPTVLSRLSQIRFGGGAGDPNLETGALPPWHARLKDLLVSTGVTATEILALSEEIAKDRGSLPVFFRTYEGHLSGLLKAAGPDPRSLPSFDRVASAFSGALRAEEDLLRHYGNPALLLDALLLDWFQTPGNAA